VTTFLRKCSYRNTIYNISAQYKANMPFAQKSVVINVNTCLLINLYITDIYMCPPDTGRTQKPCCKFRNISVNPDMCLCRFTFAAVQWLDRAWPADGRQRVLQWDLPATIPVSDTILNRPKS